MVNGNRNMQEIKSTTNQECAKNPNWNENVGYKGLHQWIKKHKPMSTRCERCKLAKVGRLELSNNSGEYKRDINDFEWLCVKCHHKKDGIDVAFLKAGKRDKNGKLNPNWRGGISLDKKEYAMEHYQINKERLKLLAKINYNKKRSVNVLGRDIAEMIT